MKVVSGSSNEDLARKIAQKLDVALSPREIFIFPDNERRIQIQEDVLEDDVVIVQSTSQPVDTNYMELFFLIDAVKRSGAKKITLVMPYVGYQRQDHIFRSGEAVSLDVVIKIIERLGVGRVIVVDPHTIKMPQFFRIPVSPLTALSIFAETIKKENWTDEDTILVSPDMGGIRRIHMISEFLGNLPYVTIVKNRDLTTGKVEISNFDKETSFEGNITIKKELLWLTI